MEIMTLKELTEKTGLSDTIIKSIIVDYDVPCVQLGDERKGRIYIDYDKFKIAFTNVNVQLRIRVQEKRKRTGRNQEHGTMNTVTQKLQKQEKEATKYIIHLEEKDKNVVIVEC